MNGGRSLLDRWLEGDSAALARPRLEAALRGAPAAARAAAGLERVLERDPDPRGLLEELARGDGLPRALALLGLGGAPVEALMAEPRDLLALTGPLPDPAALALDPGDLEALRALRRRFTLALAARELLGELPATQAAGLLSVLAARLIEACLLRARAEAAARHGEQARQARLAVLALGKLGGAELNYSSDVDLVLVRADEAPEEPAVALARGLIAALQGTSAAGRLFRVDLRLRPYGGAGALVPRLEAVCAYYRDHGRTWERQAWLKARPVAGDPALGAETLTRLAPFVWRETLEGRAIRDILALRERIEASAEEAERDVKLGPGGIRDVEFAVQFLQLLQGGRDASLRVPGTMAAIERLRAARVLRSGEASDLARSYELLRRLEHLLQLVYDRERTRLPRGEELRPLAQCLQREPAALEAELAGHRRQARRVLDTLLRAPFAADAAGGQQRVQDLLLRGPEQVDPRDAEEALAPLFKDPGAAWRNLQDLGRERHTLLAPSGRARTLLAGLAPRLLASIAARPEPDRTLRNIQRATANLGAKATVYDLWAENPDAQTLMVDLAAGSDVLTEVLAHHPGVLDEVVDRLLTRSPPRRAEVEEEVQRALRCGVAVEQALREIRALNLLLIGALDLGGRQNLQNTARSLAEVAEGFLRAFVAHALERVGARHQGSPVQGRLCVLALGRLAARELCYGSDLDLLFVWDGQAPAGDGTAPDVFWGEVVQAVLALGAGQASVEGALLPIDLRLRPGGQRAPLAVAREAALAYYRGLGPGETARDFERLALQKSRPVAGTPGFPETCQAELLGAIYGASAGRAGALLDEVAEMRRRQREQSAAEDVKRGRGSLADVELLASALALLHGAREPALREPNTARLLEALERAQRLTPAEHRDLRTAYAFLRRVELRLRARTFERRAVVPGPGPERQVLARSLGYTDVGATPAEAHFAGELAFHRQRVEAVTALMAARERLSPEPTP